MAGERLDPNIPENPGVLREPADSLWELKRELEGALHDPIEEVTAQLKLQREIPKTARRLLERAALQGIKDMIDAAVGDLLTQPNYDEEWKRGLSPAIKQSPRDARGAKRNKRESEEAEKDREAYLKELDESWKRGQKDQSSLDNLIEHYNLRHPNHPISGPGRVLLRTRIGISRGDPNFREVAREEFELFVQKHERDRQSSRPQSPSQPPSETPDYSIQSPPSVAGSSRVPQIHPVKDLSNDEDGWNTVKSFLTASAVLPLAVLGFLAWTMADDAQNNRASNSPPPIPPGVSEKNNADNEDNFPAVIETPTPAPVSEPAPVIPTQVNGIFLKVNNKTLHARVCVWKGGEGDHDPAKLNRLVQDGEIVIGTAGGVACVYFPNNPPKEGIDYLK